MRLAAYSALRRVTRFLAQFRGGRWLAHQVRMAFVEPRSVLIDDFDGDLRINCRLDEHMGSQIYWLGAYSRGELRVLDSILSEDMVFVDVGANQGEFSLFAAKRLPSGRVLAFEPLSHLYEKLEANVVANGFTNIELFKLGLGAQPGFVPIYGPVAQFLDGTVHDGLSSLYPSSDRSAEIETVEISTLDSMAARLNLDRVDVVKVDVEGAEYDVLAGARHVLDRFNPVLLVEVNPPQLRATGRDLQNLLELLERRHQLFVIGRSGRLSPLSRVDIGEMINVLCIPQDRT